ncbi:Manganese/iron superoxide dismutase [Zopfochytrium polystomum]|nr:Manganese/iron superoxide dismutase [Zopfochytrium polystomum]
MAPESRPLIRYVSAPPLSFAPDALEPHFCKEAILHHYHNVHIPIVEKLNALLNDDHVVGRTRRVFGDDYSLDPTDFAPLVLIFNHISYDVVLDYVRLALLHWLMWKSMRPNKSTDANRPTGIVASLIDASFGSYDAFKAKLIDVGQAAPPCCFIMVVQKKSGQLDVHGERWKNLVSRETPSLLVCDMWEHAHHMDYLGDRWSYLNAWLKVANWEFAESRIKKRSIDPEPRSNL